MDPMTIAYVLAATGGVFTLGGLLSPRAASATPSSAGAANGGVVIPSGGGSGGAGTGDMPPRNPHTRQLQEAINAYARVFPGVVSEYPIDVDGWFGPQTNASYLQVAAHAADRGRRLPGVERIRTASSADFGNVWTRIDGAQVNAAVTNMAKVMQDAG